MIEPNNVDPGLVSVVIPARNAATTLEAQLAALADQDYPGDLEIIVADNGSTDDTIARVRSWEGRIPRLRIISAAGRPGPAHARNAGIAAATSDLVLLCDADDVADRAWVRHLVDGLKRADAVAGGTVGFSSDAPPAGAPMPRPFGRAGFGFLPGLMSCSCGFRRAAWASVGGFDETYPIATCEDIDIAWRLQLAGYRLAQVPEGFVYYREPSEPRAVLRTWYRYGRYQPLLMKKFASAGLRRESAARVLAGWARLLLTAYRLAGPDDARRLWCRDFGRRVGRIVGSIRTRTVFL